MRIDVLIGTAVDGCSLLQIKGDGFDHAGEDKDGHGADKTAVGENNAGNGLEHGQTDEVATSRKVEIIGSMTTWKGMITEAMNPRSDQRDLPSNDIVVSRLVYPHQIRYGIAIQIVTNHLV